MIDQVIDRKYHILRKLGEGGMGSVFLAKDMILDREVALKIINPHLATDPKLLSRFKVEAIAQAKFHHPNIVVLHDFSQSGNLFYIVMEYVEGKSLKQVIREEGALTIPRVINIFRQILSAISYAHKNKVIHRDIKPGNILLTSDDTVKITDFGIAKVFGIEGLTSVGVMMGTPWYSSPEQILGGKIDERTDIYSLGVTLFEMLTGKVPFESPPGSEFEIVRAHVEKEPPPPRSINPAIPIEMENIVLKALEKNPEKRFKNVDEFASAIEKFVEASKRRPETKLETFHDVEIKKELSKRKKTPIFGFLKERAELFLGFFPLLPNKVAILVNILIFLFLLFIISIVMTSQKKEEPILTRAPMDFSKKVILPPTQVPLEPSPSPEKPSEKPSEPVKPKEPIEEPKKESKQVTEGIKSIPTKVFFKKDLNYIKAVKERLENQIRENPSDGESLALLGRIELEFFSNYTNAFKYLKSAIDLGFSIYFSVYHEHASSTEECYGELKMNKQGEVQFTSLTFPEHNFSTFDTKEFGKNFISGFHVIFLQGKKKVRYDFIPLSKKEEDEKFIVDFWKKCIKI